MANKSPKEIPMPAWIPPMIAKKICGKLNVLRERFCVQEDGQYQWVGEE